MRFRVIETMKNGQLTKSFFDGDTQVGPEFTFGSDKELWAISIWDRGEKVWRALFSPYFVKVQQTKKISVSSWMWGDCGVKFSWHKNNSIRRIELWRTKDDLEVWSWYENSTLKRHYRTYRGKISGAEIWWYANGRPWICRDYDKGVVLFEKMWWRTGGTKSTSVYKYGGRPVWRSTYDEKTGAKKNEYVWVCDQMKKIAWDLKENVPNFDMVSAL
jgi:hypothetical protein